MKRRQPLPPRDARGRFARARPAKRKRTSHAKRSRVRRNVDIFTDGTGKHPIRDSAGYREWLTGGERGQKARAELHRKRAERRLRRRG